MGLSFSVYVQNDISDYIPFLRKWMKAKGLIHEESNISMIASIGLRILLSEMWKDLDKQKVDEIVKSTKRKGIILKWIDSSVFKKVLK